MFEYKFGQFKFKFFCEEYIRMLLNFTCTLNTNEVEYDIRN